MTSIPEDFQNEVEVAKGAGSARNPDWTQDEHILALDLYFRFNLSKIGKKHALALLNLATC